MREAIGATWILGIVLGFIALFSGYLAFSVNYSKAFSLKEGIVDRIEKHGGANQDAIEDIYEYMSEISYSSKGICSTFFNSDDDLDWIGVNKNVVTKSTDVTSGGKYNYCLQKVNAYNYNGQLSASYYKVYVFFSISLPFLNNSFFNVTGETSNIYYPDDVF